jgi:hypothetical protein
MEVFPARVSNKILHSVWGRAPRDDSDGKDREVEKREGERERKRLRDSDIP